MALQHGRRALIARDFFRLVPLVYAIMESLSAILRNNSVLILSMPLNKGFLH